jgi:uncharacterized membrane protein
MGNKSTVNVSNVERIASVLAGSYVIYTSLKSKPKNFAKIASAGLLVYRGVTGHCPVYEGTGKNKLTGPSHNITIATSVLVNSPIDTVYAFWRRLENLPLFMKHLKSVKQNGDGTSDWHAYIPGGLGSSIHWKAKITHENPGEEISWKSIEDSTIYNKGRVTFEDADVLGTRVNVMIGYEAPFGMAGEKVLSLFTRKFEKMIRKDILNFKSYIETGKLPEEKEEYSDAE